MKARAWTLMLLAAVLMAACAPQPAPTPEATATALPPLDTPTPLPPTPTLIPLPTSSAPTAPAAPAGVAPVVPQIPGACMPQVKANSIINVRNGPGMNYSIIGSMAEGETARIDGKDSGGTWWRIVFAAAVNGHGWVAASVTTTSCMNDTIPVISSSELPVPFVAAVTNIVVSVSPSEEFVPGCAAGEAHKFTASGTIYASGPMQIQYSWEIEGYGTTQPQTLTFGGYESKSVSFTFKPEVEQGGHPVRLWIEGMNMQGFQYQTSYKITC